MKSTRLTIVQGTPFKFLVKVKYRDENGTMVALPLTGCSIKLQARKNTHSDLVLLELSTEGRGISVNPDAGEFTLSLSSEETASLVWDVPHTLQKAIFQVEVTKPNGEVIRVLSGFLTLDPEVVR